MKPFRNFLKLIFIATLFSLIGLSPSFAQSKAENFEKFNQRFHTDSVFQLKRIAFPVGGGYFANDTSFSWTPENWILHRKAIGEEVDKSMFDYSLRRTDRWVIEKITIPNSGFSFERRFSLKNRLWYLTFCKETNY